MAVTEILRGLGQWSVQIDISRMDEQSWRRVADSYFGHICIHVGRPDVRVSGDSLLRSSRYTGVYIGTGDAGDVGALDGFGMAYWLGDAENKGDIRETLLTFPAATPFDDVIRALLPASGSVVEGTIHDIPETWEGTHQYQTPLQDIDYVCQTKGAAWRVNGDATLDAGYESHLFAVNPKTVVMRKLQNGFDEVTAYDMFMRGLNGTSQTSRDTEDFTTRVVLLAQNAEGTTSTATADILPGLNPYKDMHGNSVKITRIVQESDTDPTNAEARPQLQLNRFTGTRDALTLSTANYDVKGHLSVGDYIWVCDPLMDLVDPSNEVMFRGKLINPLKLQLTETTWPIVQGHAVLFRTYDGEWIDLTDFVIWEGGETSLVVGGYNRSLTSGGVGVFPVTPPEVDTTIPGEVEWDLPWVQSQYQSPITGESRAEVELKWQQPLNTDGSSITDGLYYEIRYRQSAIPLAEFTVAELENYQLDELNTVENPIALDIAEEWQYTRAPFEVLKFRLQELTPGMTYEAQIRAVDTARPPNLGAWSDEIQWQASRDIFPPFTPAAPFIAAGPLAVLFRHNLGRADGGEFNLDRDLGHLELHGSLDPLFIPSNETLIGKAPADWGMITGEVPVVASFQVTQVLPMYYKIVAVDKSGNKSLPSAGVVATAELIGNQYIQSLTVDKVTAGTIQADWLIGSYIRTARTGARVELSYEGIHGYNHLNQRLLDWQSSDGSLNVIGDGGIKVRGGGNVEITDGALIVYNANGNKIVELGECADGRHGLQVYKDNGTRTTRVGELQSGSEGIETISDLGALVRIDTLAFGTKAASVVTKQGRIGGWGDLATVGPLLNVDIGNSGRCIVIVSAGIEYNTLGGGNAAVGFDMAGTGGYFRGANVFESIWMALQADNSVSTLSVTKAIYVSGITPGNLTIAMKYWTGGQSHNFFDRHLIAIPF